MGFLRPLEDRHYDRSINVRGTMPTIWSVILAATAVLWTYLLYTARTRQRRRLLLRRRIADVTRTFSAY